MRFRSTFNWLLLGVNVLLFVFLVRSLLPPQDKAWAWARKVAAELNEALPESAMNVYCVRDPFAILVDKDFPRKGAFDVLVHGQPLIISVDDVDGNDEVQKAARIDLDTDFSIGCTYSSVNGIQVHEITLYKNNAYLLDLNADGFFDLRIPCDPKQPRESQPTEVWYKGKWRETTRGKGPQGGGKGKSQRYLSVEGLVLFDMKNGVWLSPKDKPSQRLFEK